MKHVPFPLRVAAGLAVTTVERVRGLPKQLVELPVTVASQALQLTMRVQQEITELAIKGDDALSSFRRPEETPEWATFDEDLDDDVTDVTDTARQQDAPAARTGRDDADAPAARTGNGSVPGFATDRTSQDLGVADPWAEEELALAENHTEGEFDSPATTAAPGGLENYDELTLPRVRARLRSLSLPQLEELLAYERQHQNRPSFVGMLTRRIANVRQAEDTADGE
ncbi:lipid droplet-associated protein [Saccharomonospora sp. NB11]|uniref:lipid droplet-associated protein n=1 Tax=Saccharomonospora sp. NB11 TaxID=1642298 RepID=UPI0018D0E458|nr:lipid droplet-associated protein [Saccharomonospora sp. NB11]